MSQDVPIEKQPQRAWTMRERKDLWITKWASIVTLMALPVTAIWVVAHKDQNLMDLQSRQESMEKRMDGMRELLDKILLKQPTKP